MSSFIRRNAWNQEGTFQNEDLVWYAKGVAVLQSFPLDDPRSWWFFAAIHGQYVVPPQSTFPGWQYITQQPDVPTSPLPSQNLRDMYWDQCQHQSWYFAPWHRGYLIALEAQIREVILQMGGPAHWALPYWNYFGPAQEYQIPPAFTEQTLPDGSPNPLYVKARYGPNNTGDVFIPIPPIEQECQRNTIYTGSNPSTPFPGYGGPPTGFSHYGRLSGNLESNPHNKVHTAVGGYINDTDYGLMSDPGTAALDPIFYLHHCNIDRLWASWNENGNSNPTDPSWLEGPAASGERGFVMPINGSPWIYTPAQMDSLDKVNYTYESLSTGVSSELVSKLHQRLNKLGFEKMEIKEETNMNLGARSELVGANQGKLRLESSGARTKVRLESNRWQKVALSLFEKSTAALPDRVYLQLENVRGKIDANSLFVSVNQKQVGSVSLFGLRKASMEDGPHGGSGLTFLIDITDTIDDLHLDNSLQEDSLDVVLLPDNEVPASESLTVDRISIYREGQQ